LGEADARSAAREGLKIAEDRYSLTLGRARI